MSGQPEAADEGRFVPRESPAAGGTTDPEGLREDRLAVTLREVGVCLHDGEELVAMGKDRFDGDWVVRRAARNVVTELAETATRLPDRFKEQHPDIPWRAIAGMRNRVVHAYEHADPEIVWNVLANDFPVIRSQLGIGDFGQE